jgi:transposase
MPHHEQRSHADTDVQEVVLGVDTHKDVHVAAVITVGGVLLSSAEFTTTDAGFGVLRRAGVEGTGSCGAALTRHLRRQGISVVEVNRPDRAARRRNGKTDVVAAASAPTSVKRRLGFSTRRANRTSLNIARRLRLRDLYGTRSL